MHSLEQGSRGRIAAARLDAASRPDAVSWPAAASLMVPADIATENDSTVNDVREYLAHDEWEVALTLLEELGGDTDALPPGFWESLATAAERTRLDRSAAWCRWRSHETRHGIIVRADTLTPAGAGRRRAPLPGAGVLRPLWDIGHRNASGGPDLCVAALWAELPPPSVEPGRRAVVRLVPLSPSKWRHLRISAGRATLPLQSTDVGYTVCVVPDGRGRARKGGRSTWWSGCAGAESGRRGRGARPGTSVTRCSWSRSLCWRRRCRGGSRTT